MLRFKSAVSICAAAALSLGLFATGATAFRHPSPNGRCRIRMYAAPRRISAGEPVTIFGRLVCRREPRAAEQVVRLFHHVPGVPGFTFVQSTTTDANGFYEFQNADAPIETSRLFHVRAHGAESANRIVRVAPRVTLEGPPEGTQILTGYPNRVTFTGTVGPADIGARVILQRQNATTGGEWRRIDAGRVQENGAFSITHTFIVPGDASLRVLVRGERRDITGESNVLSYEISQAQNSELTIEASADPIAFGQSVTIGGTLVKGATQPVTLLARTAHQPGFAPVAQATTDANGKYSFPAQVPVNSTFYEVQGAGKTSAVLFEGVKYLLAAQISATTVQEGQTLTFTGSVAPSHPEHVIYLERRNAAGTAFRVVRVATLTAQSTFSIGYQVYGTGSQVFRVYIPGGPENEGAASEPFAVQVNPAPAAALVPEAPGNSTAPSEGSEAGSEKPGVEGEGEGPTTGGREHRPHGRR